MTMIGHGRGDFANTVASVSVWWIANVRIAPPPNTRLHLTAKPLPKNYSFYLRQVKSKPLI
jgi:hypothetical protein